MRETLRSAGSAGGVRRRVWTLLAWTVLLATAHSAAALEVQKMTEDKGHVRTWNDFAQAVYALHQHQLKGREVRTESHLGGYAGLPDYYKEVSYYDARTGQLLSRIQWEREHPDKVHVIEVFIRDAQGRITRDYTASFLPFYRNAPSQTLISLHHYAGKLHGFRTFDASGARIFERCAGVFQDRDVAFMFDEDGLDEAQDNPSSVMHKPVYEACFGTLQTTAEGYLTPH